MPAILKPDAGKLLYLVIGVLVVPRVLTIVRSKTSKS
jgi:hypothetical protein